jgi:UDP-glucose 4-epimerase
VTDLAAAHFLALKHMMKTKKSDFFNLGTGRGYSVQEVIRKTEKITGLKVPVKIGPRREGDPPRLIAQSKKAQKVLGWKPKYSDLENILRTAWRWHQKWHGELKIIK